MPHSHKHQLSEMAIGERRLSWAIGINTLLTAVQVLGGIISGSLSLIADALHNFSDAISLMIALIAIRIGKRSPDRFKTFGYKRAGIIAALINFTTLIVIGLYLSYEAITRFISPEPIRGWIVVVIATVALIIDIITALLTYGQSKHSLNIKAAFIHNITDALASVGVIVAGSLILLYNWVWTDAAITLILSGYVLWQGFTEIPKVIHILMEGTPASININDVINALENAQSVTTAHHVHVWQLDETYYALEAHIIVDAPDKHDKIKKELKSTLLHQFNIEHSTLELEHTKSKVNPNQCR